MDIVEVWKNAGHAQIVVLRNGPNGLPRHELITGMRTFSISPEDRRMNQNMAADPKLDVFSNGMLQPINLPEDTEPEVTDNPNHLSDAQLPSLFRTQIRTFTKRVETISNPALLNRLIEIAPGHDVTMRQMEVLKGRLAQVAEKVNPDHIETDEQGMRKVNPVTPR
jgi:hypothetical protein